jgi:hypothetical protein
MPDISNKFVVVTITQQEARVWATGIAPGSLPEKIYAPIGINNHHFRDDPKIKGRGDGPGVPVYFEEIVRAISAASEILIIGHGNGKARGMVHFMMYLERKHPELAKKVVDTLDTNIFGMTQPEILAMARDWFKAHPQVVHGM